ncbi:MAG: electron transfer flavoprotein subunit alpha/FixB family protein [Terriglobales bacterium]
MADEILVVAESRNHQLAPVTAEVVTAGQKLAADSGAELRLLALEGPSDDLASGLAGYQCAGALRAKHAALAAYSPEAYTQALVQVLSRRQPRFVLFAHSYRTRDFAPRLATRMARGFISDATAIRVENGRPIASRPMFEGRLAADAVFAGEPPYFLSLQIGVFRGDQAARAAAPVAITEEAVTPAAGPGKSEEPFQEAKHAVDLTQAGIIVAVGRGIKEAKNLELVEKLAAALGGEIAASRPICDSGWLPMDRQVGSSGQTVAPKLYLAVGVSGAIQHLVGMKGSRSVVAINKDPEAPIFELADYGAVGDLFEIVPALTAEIQKLKP